MTKIRTGVARVSYALQEQTDALLAVYLCLTAIPVIVFRQRVPYWEVYATIHLVAASLIVRLRTRRTHGIVRFLRDWYPVILLPFLFKEVEVFASAFGDWSLTEPVRELETRLFSGHPSLYLADALPYVALSEVLHFCYLSHIFLLPLVGGIWYAKHRFDAFHELVFLVSVTCCLSYLFFILFPVDSPFYSTPAPGEPVAGYPFYELAHFISGYGGARGGAFPSSHVSVATVIWLVAWQRQRSLAILLVPVVAGILVATVYGRFHYALDVFAGLTLAVTVVTAYRLSADRTREQQAEAA